jgi:hypothetical protein
MVKRLSLALAGLLLCGVSELNGQSRIVRRNTTARPPATPAPTTTPPLPRIVGTTGEEPETQPTPPAQPGPTPEAVRRPQTLRMEDLVIEQNAQRRSLNRLAGSLEVLSTKIGFLEAQQRQTFDLQRLMYAEQRADNLRKQLLETQTKEIELQTRFEQVEYEIRPEVIDRLTAYSGSTRPEDVREVRRKALDNERKRLASQLEILKRNRERLEIAVPQADAEVDRLREQLEKDSRELRERFENAGPTTAPPPAKPKPTPAPETNPDPPR